MPRLPEGFRDLLNRSGGHLLEFQDPKYAVLHFDDLRYRDLPEGLTAEDAWFLLKFQRFSHYRKLPLQADDGRSLVYRMPPQLEELVHKIDALGGQWFESRTTDQEEGYRFVRSALIEEAISSSLIEGVATTREVARDMLRTGRAPRDDAEQAVVNNLAAMEFVLANQTEPLTPEFIRRLHGILADGWLPADQCGVFRSTDDIVVEDVATGEVLHRPPSHTKLPARIEALCAFANEDLSRFLHPLVRAAVLHFMLGYEHPFHDGNGRTARALFHWSILAAGFRMYEYLPVSRKILKASAQYPRAFSLTETDDFDLTYFLHFQFKTVKSTLEEAHDYLSRKRTAHRNFLYRVRHHGEFNYRQQALLIRALNRGDAHFTVRSHANSHGVTGPTARGDLVALEDAGLLRSWMDGRKAHWVPAKGLKEKLTAAMPKHRRRRRR